jgi:DnaJ-domain-containing protein 1
MRAALLLIVSSVSFLLLGPVGLFLALCIFLVLNIFLRDFLIVADRTAVKVTVLLLRRLYSINRKDAEKKAIEKKILLLPMFHSRRNKRNDALIISLIRDAAAEGLWTEKKAAELLPLLTKRRINLINLTRELKPLIPVPFQAYDILGLQPESSWERVRQQYREKLKKQHPDASPDADSHEKTLTLQVAVEKIRQEKSCLYEINPVHANNMNI